IKRLPFGILILGAMNPLFWPATLFRGISTAPRSGFTRTWTTWLGSCRKRAHGCRQALGNSSPRAWADGESGPGENTNGQFQVSIPTPALARTRTANSRFQSQLQHWRVFAAVG